MSVKAGQAGPSFQDHVLAVAETNVTLVDAERSGRIELLQFEAEPPCWRSFSGPGGQTVLLKPDAYLRLAIGELEHSAFVEVDLGTESAPTIARKCGVYAAYWRTGLEQGRRGVFPMVLWLVRDTARRARIATVVAGLPAEVRALFRVALITHVVEAITDAKGGNP